MMSGFARNLCKSIAGNSLGDVEAIGRYVVHKVRHGRGKAGGEKRSISGVRSLDDKEGGSSTVVSRHV